MRHVWEAVAQRMIGIEDSSVRDLEIADRILDYIRLLPPPLQKDIGRLIILFEYLPLLIIRRFGRFSRLSPENQDRYVEAWGTSRIGLLRTGFRVLKSLSVSTYYQDSRSWKAVGYEE